MSASRLEKGKEQPIYKTMDQMMDRSMAWRCVAYAFLSALRVVVSAVFIYYFVAANCTGLYFFVGVLGLEAIFSFFETMFLLLGAVKGEVVRMVTTFNNLKKLPVSRRFAFVTHNKPFADWHLVVCGHLFLVTILTLLVSFVYLLSSSLHIFKAAGATLFLVIGLIISYAQLNSFYEFVVLGAYRSVVNFKSRIAYGKARANHRIKTQLKTMVAGLPLEERKATVRTEKKAAENRQN